MKEEEEETFEGKSYIEKKCNVSYHKWRSFENEETKILFFARERVCCKRDGFYQGGL